MRHQPLGPRRRRHQGRAAGRRADPPVRRRGAQREQGLPGLQPRQARDHRRPRGPARARSHLSPRAADRRRDEQLPPGRRGTARDRLRDAGQAAAGPDLPGGDWVRRKRAGELARGFRYRRPGLLGPHGRQREDRRTRRAGDDQRDAGLGLRHRSGVRDGDLRRALPPRTHGRRTAHPELAAALGAVPASQRGHARARDGRSDHAAHVAGGSGGARPRRFVCRDRGLAATRAEAASVDANLLRRLPRSRRRARAGGAHPGDAGQHQAHPRPRGRALGRPGLRRDRPRKPGGSRAVAHHRARPAQRAPRRRVDRGVRRGRGSGLGSPVAGGDGRRSRRCWPRG